MKPEYPLELVATLAAHLLKGENYEDAVRKARKLIFEAWCQNTLTEMEYEMRRQEQAKAEWDHGTKNIPFAKAVRKITGTDNEADATKAFRDLLRKQHERNANEMVRNGHISGEDKDRLPEQIEAKIANQIAELKLTGFSQGDIEFRQREYWGEFPRRRPKPRKKSFSHPRGGKTPE